MTVRESRIKRLEAELTAPERRRVALLRKRWSDLKARREAVSAELESLFAAAEGRGR